MNKNNDQLIINIATQAYGTVQLPGSKSISNRALLLAAICSGTTTLTGVLASDDTNVMLESLAKMGVKTTALAADSYAIQGGVPFANTTADLFLGNAGTAMRSLTAALAFMGGELTVGGIPRMHERPIGDLVDALNAAGATVEYLANTGYPPLRIGQPVLDLSTPIRVKGSVSSQFLTALLMAAPIATAKTGKALVIEVEGTLISQPYIAITLDMMARFGVSVEHDQNWQRFVVASDARYVSPGTLHVEGDASSASYFLALGTIGGGPIDIQGVGSLSVQGDVQFARVAEHMGATVEFSPNAMRVTGKNVAKGEKLNAFDLDFNHIPDAAMTAAAMAIYADGPCTLRNIASWRVKETDRIEAMKNELQKLGAKVESGADWLRVYPIETEQWQANVQIETYDDHRIAMCLSLAAFGPERFTVLDPNCVSKTFPTYFSVFEQLVTPVITIDGPTASGKGTVATLVAQQLGWQVLDSGALYRLTALSCVQQQIDLDDEVAVAAQAAQLNVLFSDGRSFLNDEDVTDSLRAENIGIAASKVAAYPAVREALLQRQRDFRQGAGLVADGRDMGTVIFPDAPLKIFLVADVQSRAQRRYRQLIDKGISANLSDLLADLQARDLRDTSRAAAPLAAATDAYTIDSSALSIEETVNKVLAYWATTN